MSSACAAGLTQSSAPPSRRTGLPILALGFRPFYLAGAIYAALALPLWLLLLAGRAPAGLATLGVDWHAHEMIYGFAVAIVTGFLFTAVPNWTRRATPTDKGLAACVALWLAGRLAMLAEPGPLTAAIDLAFLPVVAIAVARPIIGARIWRNLFVVLLLTLLWLGNLAFHLDRLGAGFAVDQRTALLMALDVFAILVAAIGGRVIPAFIGNAVPGARPMRLPGVEFAAMGSLFFILLLEPLHGAGLVEPLGLAPVFALAAAAHVVRLACWSPLRTWRQPLLWILPLAYAWLPVTLALRGLAMVGVLPEAAGLHAFTVGAIGGMTLAMMTRSALGHTGRRLVAGRPELLMFLLVQVAAVARVTGPLASEAYLVPLCISGLAWTAAFGLFAITYWPRLTRARVDARPG
jgi:uncharacterized protein involved in response to NO